MADDLGERTEEPTAKRRWEARQRGEVGKSRDLSAAIVMIGVVVVLLIFGKGLFIGMMRITHNSLAPLGTLDELSVEGAKSLVMHSVVDVAFVVLPVMALLLVIGYLAELLQVGFLFSTKALEPNLNRLNVIKGLGKLFSKRSLIKGAIDVGKFAVITAVVWMIVAAEMPAIIGTAGLSLMAGVVEATKLVVAVAAVALAMLVLLGIIDRTYQQWQQTQDLKMTKQDVKDERKSMEGDPLVKARRMRTARQIAMQRLQSDVPKADVIVTNPTHFSVALKYDQATMAAPKVVAKGADFLALRIRQIAQAHGVPIVERAPLARALYRRCEVGHEVPMEQYEAVAEVLAYVYRLENRVAS